MSLSRSNRSRRSPTNSFGIVAAVGALAVGCGGVSPEDVVFQEATAVEMESGQGGMGAGNDDGAGGADGMGGENAQIVTAADALSFFDGEVVALMNGKCALCHAGPAAVAPA
ncbi:MAG: hypothetical protein AAFQ82_17500, partial [Myxococcota bacterium]